MRRIAFATYQDLPGVTEDDQLLVEALSDHDIRVDAHPWDSDAAWHEYAAVLPRSAWDFHLKLPAFLAWIACLASAGVPLLNPARLLEWNVSKRYLQALQARGVNIVPTSWVAKVPNVPAPVLSDTRSRHGWYRSVVIKPIVSASAHDTWVADGTDPQRDDARFQEALSGAPLGLMVQPFLRQIQSNGEWSLIFVGGRFSHAVLKRPAAGDFRVQVDHGGSSAAALPPAWLVADATRVLDATARCTDMEAGAILYARIDGVDDDGRLLLMEVEVIEPALFLRSAPHAAWRMAAGICDTLGRSSGRPSKPEPLLPVGCAHNGILRTTADDDAIDE